MISNQFNVFLAFVLIGIVIGFVFDFFRILRRVYKTPDFITILEDITFWLISGIILLLGIFILNKGRIRAYLFLGLFSGICIYIAFISKIIMNIGISFFKLLNKNFFVPICKGFRFISQLFLNLVKFLIKISKKVKNNCFQSKKIKDL